MATTPDVLARGALEIRVCVRTYRLFYVPHTEDFLLHVSSKDEKATMRKRKEKLRGRQRAWAKEVGSGEWSERRMASSAGAGVDPTPEGNWGPGTSVVTSMEAGSGPSADGRANTSGDLAAGDHDVGANISSAS